MKYKIEGDDGVIESGFIHDCEAGLQVFINLKDKFVDCSGTMKDGDAFTVWYYREPNNETEKALDARITFSELPYNIDRHQYFNGRDKWQDMWLFIPWEKFK